MKLTLSKAWFEANLPAEDGLEIGAGLCGPSPRRVHFRTMADYMQRPWVLRFLSRGHLTLVPPYPPQWVGWMMANKSGALVPTCPDVD